MASWCFFSFIDGFCWCLCNINIYIYGFLFGVFFGGNLFKPLVFCFYQKQLI